MARGPAYPYINLSDALALAKGLFDFAKRGPANLNAVLKDKWDYSPTSSSAVKVVAALKYFGLVDVIPGAKDQPDAIRITDRAYRILVDSATSPERLKALKDACLAPKAYRMCWDTWGAEMPQSMRSTLIFSHGFNDSTVDIFLTNYKKSVQFAGLLDVADEKDRSSEQGSGGKSAPSVGDFVQWEHAGVLGFPQALKLVKFSDDGTYAWVEGHSTGLPVGELVKAEAPPIIPPQLPPAGEQRLRREGAFTGDRTLPPKGAGMRQEVFSLDEGDVTIQWPDRISTESLKDFEEWLTILQRKVRRSVTAPPPVTPRVDE